MAAAKRRRRREGRKEGQEAPGDGEPLPGSRHTLWWSIPGESEDHQEYLGAGTGEGLGRHVMDCRRARSAGHRERLQARLRGDRSEEEVVAELKAAAKTAGSSCWPPTRIQARPSPACLRAAEADEDPGAADPLQRDHQESHPEASRTAAAQNATSTTRSKARRC